MAELFKGYVIDSGPLIYLFREKSPPDIYPSVWDENHLCSIVNQGLLVAPREVFHELDSYEDKKTKSGKDKLWEWARDNKKMFIDPDDAKNNYIPFAIEIANRTMPGFGLKLVDENKETPDADPFVIALAKHKGWTVINSERYVHPDPKGRPKIPNVCSYYGIECIDLNEFFRRQNWKF